MIFYDMFAATLYLLIFVWLSNSWTSFFMNVFLFLFYNVHLSLVMLMFLSLNIVIQFWIIAEMNRILCLFHYNMKNTFFLGKLGSDNEPGNAQLQRGRIIISFKYTQKVQLIMETFVRICPVFVTLDTQFLTCKTDIWVAKIFRYKVKNNFFRVWGLFLLRGREGYF